MREVTRGAGPTSSNWETQLRLLVDAQTDYAMFVLDPGGHIVTWNLGAERIKGWSREEIVGQHFSRFYTEEALARNHPAHELEVAAREGRFEEEGWRLRKDGSQFWANVVITALRDESGKLVGFGKVTRDLTSRRLAEEQLRSGAAELQTANRELVEYQMLVASVRDYAIFMLDAGGHIRTWNAGAEHIKGYTADEVVGRHFELFYTDEDRARRHPANELEIAAREGSYEEEGWRIRKDGTRFWANVLITALRNEHGTLVGYAKVTRDLTERRAADEALRATAHELERSNTALEQFAASAAHDLVEPLHTIHGLSELLARAYGERLDEAGRTYLAEIASGAQRLRSMIDGLLEYSRASQHPLDAVPVRIADVVEDVVRALREPIDERGVRVEYDAGALPVVSADPALLNSILQNLLANAVKFSQGAGARVTVGAEPADPGHWRITVADGGIGIDSKQRERIFGLFTRLNPNERYAGTGLGLPLARRLVHRHGGDIGVDSTPGEGSRFWFTLPAAHA